MLSPIETTAYASLLVQGSQSELTRLVAFLIFSSNIPVKWVKRNSALRYDTLHPVMEVWVRWGLEGSWSSMALYASKLHPARMRASFQSNGLTSGGGGGGGEVEEGEEEEEGDDDAEARR
jgi:hypothetical protein